MKLYLQYLLSIEKKIPLLIKQQHKKIKTKSNAVEIIKRTIKILIIRKINFKNDKIKKYPLYGFTTKQTK